VIPGAGDNAAAPPPLIYIVVGEPSGDQLGALLVRALRAESGGRVRFAGLAGERMKDEGLGTLFPISELALMGLEIVPRLPRLLRRIDETVRDIRARAPAALVTIDAQGFSKRIGKALRGSPFPIIQYVAPTVWAWKPWRARTVARYLAHLLTIFPFEAPFFDRHGLASTFVGHPAAEGAGHGGDRRRLRERLGISQDALVLCALPGSRRGEVRRHLPIFGATLALLKRRFPELHCILPTVPAVADAVAEAARRWPIPTSVLRDPRDKPDAFAAADVALAASGTVTSEAAFARLATIVMYRISPPAAAIAHAFQKVSRIKYASAVNLVVDREVLPEFIQYTCKPPLLAAAVGRLLADPAARQEQIRGVEESLRLLSVGDAKPSRVAAATILRIIAEWEAKRRRPAISVDEPAPQR
jgi:lipid-A-disaccharide synthase